MGNYRDEKRSKSNSVWFRTLDKSGKVIRDYKGAACFAQIIYSGGMHHDTKTIHVYRSKDMMPYNIPEIKRWIDDINEMNFPCRFVDDGIVDDDKKQEAFIKKTIARKMRGFALDIIRGRHPVSSVNPKENYNFYVDLKNYKDKSHLFSTLSLIRMLSESYYDGIPEKYFTIIDNNPKKDKFQALQDAHKQSNANGGHCVTFADNGANITLKELMSRFKENNADLWDGRLAINACWSGRGGQ